MRLTPVGLSGEVHGPYRLPSEMRIAGNTVVAYVLAVLAAATATLLRLFLDPVLGETSTFQIFALAVAVAAWWGGKGPGLLATALCLLSAWYWLAEHWSPPRQIVAFGVFVLVSYGIVEMFDMLRRAQADLRRAREQSENERLKVEALSRDLERRAAELETANEALRHADQAKNTFVAAIAHELRNPLQPIRSCARLLKAKSEDPQTVTALAKIIERQSDQASRIVEDLLDLSRVALGRLRLAPAWVKLDEVIEAALEQVEHSISSKSQRVELTGTLSVATWADRDRLVQVFANLIGNASKFTAENGTIHVAGHSHGDGFAVTVRDNGPGIAPEFLSSIFNLYVQENTDGSRSRGLGLGLALSKTLVEMHGGRIEARSEGPQKGAAFLLWLPHRARKGGDASAQTSSIAA
jgi:signal transduction histidine kinase